MRSQNASAANALRHSPMMFGIEIRPRLGIELLGSSAVSFLIDFRVCFRIAET
jgi:hypothetical protein